MNQTIFIPASKVAFLTGHNIYVTDNEKKEILLKYNKWLYNFININETNNITVDDIINDYDDEKLYNIYYNIKDNNEPVNDINDIKKIVKIEISNIINNSINVETEEESKELLNKINNNNDIINSSLEKYIIINRGITREKTTLDNIESLHDIKINKRNDRLYKKRLFSLKHNNINYNIIIGGKIDGMEKIDNKYILIETKNRRNRLFNTIPIYEKVQIEIYLFLIKDYYNIEECKFIENYNKLNNIIIYKHNEMLLELIKNNLKEYIIEVLNN